jgi:hypothetical protein
MLKLTRKTIKREWVIRTLIFILSIAPAHPLFSSCIFIYSSATSIIAVADSRVIEYQTNKKTGKTEKVASVICKIHPYKNYFIAIAGINEYKTLPIVIQGLQKGQTIDGSMPYIIEEIKKYFLNVLQNMAKSQKNTFRTKVHNNDLAAISIFGYENRLPKVKTVFFTLDNDNTIFITQLDNSTQFHYLGAFDHIEKLSEKFKEENYKKNGVINGMKNLIQYETKYHPDGIAPPYDVLKIDNRGVHWLEKKSQCN